MTYQYSHLSHVDFEDLCRDIAQAKLNMRFEAFGPGPDGGIDGRHSKNGNSTILQAKHYCGSNFTTLKKAIAKESPKISLLNPDRYLIFTSQSLTPKKKSDLISAANNSVLSTSDTWGKEDLDDALRQHPEIVKSHVKLWLSSSAVLDKLINSGLEAYSQATKDEIIEKLKVFVRNPSFDEAAKRLNEQKVLIISGAPGVGKTTLAEMLIYHYLNEDWKLTAITSLDEGFSKINDYEKRVFFFDDFLGRIALNKQALMQHDNALTTFVKRVRRSKNARFILTTRAHIFEEARLMSDRVDDHSIQLSKYILDVGAYTRKVKSRILFNHLYVSKLSSKHFEALLSGNWLKTIIDHKNYNPRLVATVTSELIKNDDPKSYPNLIIQALNNPNSLWEKPYRNLQLRDQNLLIALFFCSEYGIKNNELKPIFTPVHKAICEHYGHSMKPGDFEDALKSLESGFISISGKSVSFINPSVRDFLKAYLSDFELLNLLPNAARRADWSKELWDHATLKLKTEPAMLAAFAELFVPFSEKIEDEPTMIPIRNSEGYRSYKHHDLSFSGRVEILTEWWNKTKNNIFLEKILELSMSDKLEPVPWNDARDLPEIIHNAMNIDEKYANIGSQLIENFSLKLVNNIEGGLSTEDLASVIEQVNLYLDWETPEIVSEALDQAVDYEFDPISGSICDLTSEDELMDQLDHIESLALLTNRGSEKIKNAIHNKIAELEEDYEEAESPTLSPPSPFRSSKEFSDVEILSLFSTLVK